MSHPKRADHFKKWSQMMLEQAIVPERLEFKGAGSSASGKQSVSGRLKKVSLAGKRRKRRIRRKRHKRQKEE